MRLFLLLIGFVAATASKAQTNRKLTPQQSAALHNLMPYQPVKGFAGWSLAERMKHYQVPGLSMVVIKNYQIDYAASFGLADTAKGLAATNETLYSAGSISKLLLAVMTFRLAESGLVHLDSPVQRYLRSWQLKDNDFTRQSPVTLRRLLSHTAGTSQASYWGFAPGYEQLPTVVQVLAGHPSAQSRAVGVNALPGKGFQYSGGGSMIAQLVLMDVTGKSFEALADSLLFRPLNLRHSTFAQPIPAAMEAGLARPYSAAPWFKGGVYVYPQQAAAGLVCSATDLALLCIEMQRCEQGKGKLLSQASMRAMFSPVANVSTGEYLEDIGAGPFLLTNQRFQGAYGHRYFEFTGVNAGYLAYFMGSCTGGNGVVAMMNTGDNQGGLGKEIRRSVAKAYGWNNFLPLEITPAALSKQALKAAAGRYLRSADEVVSLRPEKNYWVYQVNGGEAVYLFPTGGDSARLTDYTTRAWLVRDNGKVVGLQTQWQNQPMRKMRDNEFTPSEYLAQKNYVQAKAGFAAMQLDESAITYRAYELNARPNADPEAVKMLLELGLEQHPKSVIVHRRLGDFAAVQGKKAQALAWYEKALAIDPADKELGELVRGFRETNKSM